MGHKLGSVDAAVEALERGGVVIIPTDTVYGLAASANSPDAIERIFEIKGRPSDKALQLLVAGEEWLERLGRPSAEARTLARRYWPGPLTIVIEAGRDVPAAVGGSGTVGLRVPAHPVALEILDRVGVVAATSANRSGYSTPHDVPSIRLLFGEEIDVYVDAGRIEGRASTVVDLTRSGPSIAREGAIPSREIMRALGFEFEAG